MLPVGGVVASCIRHNVKSLKLEVSACLVFCLFFSSLPQCEVVCNDFLAAGFLRHACISAFSLPCQVISIKILAGIWFTHLC